MRSHKWRHTTVTHHQLYGSKTWRYSGTYSEGVTDKYGVLYVRRGVCAAVKEPTCKWQARKKQDLPFLACSVPKLERNSFAIDTQILHLKIDSWNKKLVRTRNESACSETSFFDKRKKLQIINSFELIMHWQKLNLLYLIAIFLVTCKQIMYVTVIPTKCWVQSVMESVATESENEARFTDCGVSG